MPPMTTLGPEDRAAHLKSRHALLRSVVARGFRKRIPMITEDIRQDILFHRLSPSINTRHPGEAQTSPLSPDVPELLDVVVFARRLR
ncbi:hypothetical protein F511_07124 [Dorcoceras hygrometricum]|nr:hypothetical protein F511_07124 [Dorcoceras hygrometricum]